MSYILDALKKSDRERRQGEIPGLQNDHGFRSGHRQRKKRSFLWIGLSGVGLLGLLVLVLYWAIQRNSIALQEKIAVLEKSVVQLKESPVTVAVHPLVVKEETVSQPLASKERADSLMMPSSVVSRKADSHPLVVAADDDARLADDNAQQPQIKEKTVIRPENVPRKIEPKVGAAPLKSVMPEIVPEKADALPFVQDLPASVQKMLPPLKLAGHVYAKDPTKRMIIINNRICREGDLIENQLYLEQIVWGGVILRYQDIRFRMNLL